MMKVKPVKLGKTERMSFSHIDEVISMPNLIEVQKNSYQWFLDEGLKEVFHDIGTIEDYTGNLALSFVDFRLDKEHQGVQGARRDLCSTPARHRPSAEQGNR